MSQTPAAAQHELDSSPAAGFHRIVVAVSEEGGDGATDLARVLAAPGAETTVFSISEQPPGAKLIAALHGLAENQAADLLVIGAHRGLRDAESVLPRVLHHSPCAVAIVGQQTPQPLELRRVGVAYCASPAGEHAAAVAAGVATRRGAELHAMHVVAVNASPWMGPAAATLHTLQRLDGSLAEAAEAAIAALRPPARSHVVEGDPPERLTDFAETVDLLVVGSRSLGPLRRLMLGSVTDALSTNSASALLVVAGPEDQSGDDGPAPDDAA